MLFHGVRYEAQPRSKALDRVGDLLFGCLNSNLVGCTEGTACVLSGSAGARTLG
jgi:hypothetical protein